MRPTVLIVSVMLALHPQADACEMSEYPEPRCQPPSISVQNEAYAQRQAQFEIAAYKACLSSYLDQVRLDAQILHKRFDSAQDRLSKVEQGRGVATDLATE